MKSSYYLVAAIGYQPDRSFMHVTSDPELLAAYFLNVCQPPKEIIERSKPIEYEVRGEVAVVRWTSDLGWFRLFRSISRMFIEMQRELDLANSRYKHEGFSSAKYIAGLVTTKTDVSVTDSAADFVSSAFAAAELALKMRTVLAVDADIFEGGRSRSMLVQRLGGVASSHCGREYVFFRDGDLRAC